MTRSPNTISNLFQGYTLELESTSSSAINISSSQNLIIENLLNTFVENYNTVYLNISDMTTNAILLPRQVLFQETLLQEQFKEN